AFLIWTAWKLIQEARADEEDEEFEENKLLKAAERRFGVADRYHGTKLWIEQNGKRIMTPMLVVMLAIGTTDVLFALDSIPAIFGLTQDPYIVFTANAFALMGLRQLYFLIGGLLRKLVHLSYGLSIILGFIGVKLVLHALHESGVHVPEIGIPVSPGAICSVLVATTITSLRASRKQAEAAAAQSAGDDKDSIDAAPGPGTHRKPAGPHRAAAAPGAAPCSAPAAHRRAPPHHPAPRSGAPDPPDSHKEAMRTHDDPEAIRTARRTGAPSAGDRNAADPHVCDDRRMIARLRSLAARWTILVPALAAVLLVLTWGRD